MALVLKDRVKETTSTAGTGSVTLLGPVQGFQGFSVIGNSNTTYYTIAGTSEWEVGIGTYSGGVLSRDTVLGSSANGSKVAFSAGVKDVFVTYPAGKAITTDTFSVTGALSVAAPNTTVNVASLTAQTSSANGDLALAPKGTGALLAQVPASTIATGDKRGESATDLQRVRDAANEVASGQYSGVFSGHANKSSGTGAVVAGGYSNAATGSYSASLSGYDNEASNSFGLVVGGGQNVASGLSATVLGGLFNTSSGDGATVIGGQTNLADSGVSCVIGGSYGTTRGIVGYVSIPASAAPIAASAGVQQSGILVLGVRTLNATPTILRSDSFAAGATNQLILANNSAAYIFGYVIANVTGAGNTRSWIIAVTIKRGANAASTTVVGSSIAPQHADTGASAWDVTVAADTTNGGLAVTVTGQASTTIRWVCRLETVEVAY